MGQKKWMMAGLMMAFACCGWSKTVMLSVGAAALKPTDTNYQTFYGNTVICPNASLSIFLFKFMSLGGAWQWVKKSGIISEINEKTQSEQHWLTLKALIHIPFSKRLVWQLGGGAAYINYSEKAMNIEINRWKLGYTATSGFSFYLTGKWFVFLKGSYWQAMDTVSNREIKLGGLNGVLGLGVVF